MGHSGNCLCNKKDSMKLLETAMFFLIRKPFENNNLATHGMQINMATKILFSGKFYFNIFRRICIARSRKPKRVIGGKEFL
jgi:hypothetical protein